MRSRLGKSRVVCVSASVWLLMLSACVASALPDEPARSPASPNAQTPALRPIATSLHEDPLAAPLAPEQVGPGQGHDGDAHQHGAHQHHAPPPSAAAAPVSSPPAADGGTPPEATEYVCPMDPDVRQSQPGRCPRCGMRLVPRPIAEKKSRVESTHEHH
ncbi:MAG: heavy metal-binding domain-containing protein [Polyangiales bacterium]